MTRRKSTAVRAHAWSTPCTMAEIPAGAAVQLAQRPPKAPDHELHAWYRRTGSIAGAALVRLIIGTPGGVYRESGACWLVDEDATVIAVCDPGLPS